MKLLYLVLSLVLAAEGTLSAQDSSCGSLTSTLAQRQCLSAKLRLADSTIDAVVDSIEATLSDSSKSALSDASKQWLTYRARECDAIMRSYDGGSMGLVVNLTCLIALTNSRQKLLRAFYSKDDQ